jgi:hypothetical protein
MMGAWLLFICEHIAAFKDFIALQESLFLSEQWQCRRAFCRSEQIIVRKNRPSR